NPSLTHSYTVSIFFYLSLNILDFHSFPTRRSSDLNLRRAVPGQSLRQRFLLLGAVPLFGVCSAHLSRKSPRYRSLSSCSATQALSYGLPGPGFSQHVGTRQRTPRLADLRRFRSSLDCRRSRPLPPRTFRSGVVRDRVCPGLDDHRFVPCAFPVGEIPSPKKAR